MTRQLRVAKLLTGSRVDGPGPRAVVWTQGCSIRCHGCHNQELWPETGGEWVEPIALATWLLNSGQDITISGGEPFDQAEALAVLLATLTDLARGRAVALPNIIIYTGYTLEALMERYHNAWNGGAQRYDGAELIAECLTYAEILVDGPYVSVLDNDGLQWRGSSNQRVINMPATIWEGLFENRGTAITSGIVPIDWETQVIQIDGGQITGTGAIVAELGLSALGKVHGIARCGQFQEDDDQAAADWHENEDRKRAAQRGVL